MREYDDRPVERASVLPCMTHPALAAYLKLRTRLTDLDEWVELHCDMDAPMVDHTKGEAKGLRYAVTVLAALDPRLMAAVIAHDVGTKPDPAAEALDLVKRAHAAIAALSGTEAARFGAIADEWAVVPRGDGAGPSLPATPTPKTEAPKTRPVSFCGCNGPACGSCQPDDVFEGQRPTPRDPVCICDPALKACWCGAERERERRVAEGVARASSVLECRCSNPLCEVCR